MSEISFFHHGDCIGVDEQFHQTIRNFKQFGCNGKIVLHPPDIDSKRAFCEADITRDPKPYLERNKDIVAESGLMFIVPKEKQEQFRGSGTWATYRYTIKAKKPLFLIYPDGKFKKMVNK